MTGQLPWWWKWQKVTGLSFPNTLIMFLSKFVVEFSDAEKNPHF